MKEEDVIVEYDDPQLEELMKGKITAEERHSQLVTEWEAGKEARDLLSAKKYKAAKELIELGVSEESAYLITLCFEEM